MKNISTIGVVSSIFLLACSPPANESRKPIADQFGIAKSFDGQFISWKEHIIDDAAIAGFDLAGSDGLQYEDLNADGFNDIVSVHELDITYDGKAHGYVRIAFGSEDPHKWNNITLASGAEAGGAEDVTINDINGDGFPDIVVACELAHLIYFQNPGKNFQNASAWKKHIPSITTNRGSFIRVFSADLDRGGKVEIIAANKGDQLAQGQFDDTVKIKTSVSVLTVNGDPLLDESWKEQKLLNIKIPINARPIDIDRDGDLDIIAGSRGTCETYILENRTTDSLSFVTHKMKLRLPEGLMDSFGTICSMGFNMDFSDFNDDGRTDLVLNIGQIRDNNMLAWIEQPRNLANDWLIHPIGTYEPDELVGLRLADINGDGLTDIMTGGYSRGNRADESDVTIEDPLGRLAWFEQTEKPDEWIRRDFSRRKRGMFDQFIPVDLDRDGDLDFLTTRGNSFPYDGVLWLEQVRSKHPMKNFTAARNSESQEMALPHGAKK